MKKILKNYLLTVFAIAAIFTLGSLSGLLYFSKANSPKLSSVYERLVNEAFDKIQQNYWKKLSEEELAQTFQDSLESLTLQLNSKRVKTKSQFFFLFKKTLSSLPKEKKKELTVNLLQTTLANLEPKGKSKLLSQKEKEDLISKVKNVDKQKSLLKELEAKENDSPEVIKKKAEEKIQKLDSQAQEDPKAREEIKKLKLAEKTLTDPEKRNLYLNQGAVATVIFEPFSSDIHYLKISRISPQTWQELYNTFVNPQETNATSLIIDLRGNIGGAIDILPYFLGPFIGPGNAAYEFFHQGDYLPVKTKAGFLPGLYPYKKVVVLVDRKVQSSAEVIAAVLKKYNVGVLIGERTAGWGTVETILPLETKLENESFILFLVSNLTLRDDNQPIEGGGVEPDIEISNPNWKNELLKYFNSPELTTFVDKLWKEEIGY